MRDLLKILVEQNETKDLGGNEMINILRHIKKVSSEYVTFHIRKYEIKRLFPDYDEYRLYKDDEVIESDITHVWHRTEEGEDQIKFIVWGWLKLFPDQVEEYCRKWFEEIKDEIEWGIDERDEFVKLGKIENFTIQYN